MGTSSIDLTVLAVIISGLVLLIQLYRWLAGFASKGEVAKIEAGLKESLANDAKSDAVAHSRIEQTLINHRDEANKSFSKLGGQIDGVLNVVQGNTGKIEDLRGWREMHIEEDRKAHAIIEEVRDFMVVSHDRDERVDKGKDDFGQPRGTYRRSKKMAKKKPQA